MTIQSTTSAQHGAYDISIKIDADARAVWKALIEETNRWWVSDFRMVAPDSVVRFDLQPGGSGLIEEANGGGFLQWYQIQAFLPAQRKLYLVGHIAADFGGPSTSHMCLAIREQGGTSEFRLTDSLVGNVSEETLTSLQSGWTSLFESLAEFVERTG